MLKYRDRLVHVFDFEAEVLTTGGKLSIRAFKTMEDELKVNCFEKGSLSFSKAFYSVEEFHEWYYSLHIVVVLSKLEIMQ